MQGCLCFLFMDFLPYSLQICQHWLRQCFWNYLDWDEICLYICTCLTMGIDYQVV